MKALIRHLKLTALAVAIVTALAVPATGSAATTASVRDCTVDTYTPFITWINNVKYVQANEYVHCSVSRSGTLSMRLMEDDAWPNPDDLIRSTNVYFTIEAGTTERFSIRGACNWWDGVGNLSEPYATGQLSIDYYTSSQARSPDLSAYC